MGLVNALPRLTQPVCRWIKTLNLCHRGCGPVCIHKQRPIATISGHRPSHNRWSNVPDATAVDFGVLKTLLRIQRNALHIILLNARPILNKALSLSEYAVKRPVDFMAITETWLPAQPQASVIKDLCPAGFKFLHAPRTTGRGGGVGLLHRASVSVEQRKLQLVPKTFEALWVWVSGHTLLHMLII